MRFRKARSNDRIKKIRKGLRANELHPKSKRHEHELVTIPFYGDGHVASTENTLVNKAGDKGCENGGNCVRESEQKKVGLISGR